MSDADGAVTLAFVGYATSPMAARAIEYEDAVLPLVAEHGGVVKFRGRRTGDDASMPLEVHVLWFPSGSALNSYLADPRRQQLIASHGDVFEVKHAVEVDVIEGELH